VHVSNTAPGGGVRIREFEVHPRTQGGNTGEVVLHAQAAGRTEGTVAVPVPAWRYPGGGTFDITDITINSSSVLGVWWTGHVAPAASYPPALPEGTVFVVTTSVTVPGMPSGSGNFAVVTGPRTVVRSTTSDPSVESHGHTPGVRIAATAVSGDYTLQVMRVQVAAFYDGAVIAVRTVDIPIYVAIPLV
jgi:hypothetical protein